VHKVLTVQNDLGKMAKNEIRNKFFDLLNQLINSERAEDYKNGILEDSFYRYAVDNNARINYLEKQKGYDDLPYWNPYTIKGVHYENGICELVESEINELIVEYRVNLCNNDFGEFQNELDKNRSPALKSYNCLIMAITDCLHQQIINEMIRELRVNQTALKTPEKNFNRIVFETSESECFFNFLISEWIVKEKNKKTAISFIFREMWYKNTDSELKYKIVCTSTRFAEYWNKEYKEIYNKLDQKNPKFKKDITNEYYRTSFYDCLKNFDSREQ